MELMMGATWQSDDNIYCQLMCIMAMAEEGQAKAVRLRILQAASGTTFTNLQGMHM
jgi:hypothetical protein